MALPLQTAAVLLLGVFSLAGFTCCEPAPCERGEQGVTVLVTPQDEFYDGSLLENEGVAAVTGASPLMLEFLDDGETFEITMEGVPDALLAAGDVVYVEVLASRPWWSNAVITVWDITGDSFDMRGAAWTTSGRPSFVVGDVEISYETAPCTRETPCGDVASEVLVATRQATGKVLARVSPGFAGPPGDVGLVNGSESRSFVRGPMCTDVPSSWTAGYFMIDRPHPTGR